MTERNLFGTDGIRGVANQYPMTPEISVRLGQAIAHHFKQDNRLNRAPGHHPRILIGKDTRLSGYMFESALAAGIRSEERRVGKEGGYGGRAVQWQMTG